MTERTVVGLEPRLPWPLNQMPWWTEPVRAERLAALRIGVGAVLLYDILGCYLPYLDVFLGPGSLGDPDVFVERGADGIFHWSIFRWVHDPTVAHVLFFTWAGSALLLLLGAGTRLSAVVAWALSVSTYHINPFVINSGDNARNALLFILMLCPSGATRSVDAWLRRGRTPAATYVWPWPLRLLFVQMTVLYFMSGVFKLLSPDWLRGSAMHYFLADLAFTRLPYESLPGAALVGPVFDYVTLVWEVGFPVLVFVAFTRKPTLWLGVLFHVSTWLLFRIGPFPLYMLCFYLPLVPWERYLGTQQAEHVGPDEAAQAAADAEPVMPGGVPAKGVP
jgi:hypothetical protein